MSASACTNAPSAATRHEQARVLVISRVESALDTVTRDIGVEAVLKAIRTGGKNLRGQIVQIRNRFESELAITGGDRKAARLEVDPLKKALPAVTWSGTFSQRASECLVQHSGLFCGDLDSLSNELPRVREQLRESPYLFSLFLSPTGDGLKPVFRVPADASKHAGSFRAVEKHVLELTGLQIDKSGSDVSRLCFMSYDPELYHNPNAIEIELLPEPEKPRASVSRSAGRDSNPSKTEVRDMLAVIPKRPDYHDWIKLVAAVGDALSDDEAIEVLNEWSPEESPGEYAKKLQSGFEKIHVGTLFHLAKEHGWTPMPRNEAQPRNDETVELPPAPPLYVPPPLTLLPSELQEYAHAAAESLNVDLSFILLPLLSALGSAIGNSRSILLKRNFIQPPVIWTSIIGRSGSRKSPSLDAGCFAIVEHERELARQNKQAMEIYENELAEWESKTRKERGVKPALPLSLTCLMDNLTAEALADAIQANPHGVLVKKDELSHWFASFDQYTNAKGADVSQWLSLHSGVFFGLDRRSDHRRYRIHQPRVALSGGIQPEVLKRILTEDFFERGLPARFLFAYPPFMKDRWTETEIPDDLRAAVLALFQKIWELEPNHDDKVEACPRLLRLDADAKAQYVHYYNECGNASVEAGEREEAAWSKLSGYAARIALVGQCARDPDAELVSGETMREACNLARWSGNEAMRIYASLGESQQQRETRKLVEFINSRGGAVTVRDLVTYYRPIKNLGAGATEEAERQLNALVRAGYGDWTETKGARGPAAQVFQLLLVSASAGFPFSPSIATKPADADTPSIQKNEASKEPDAEAETLVGDESGVVHL